MRKFSLVIILIWSILAIPVFAQDDSDVCFEKGGLIDEETGQCKLHVLLEINVDYPLEYSDYPFVMEQLDNFVDSEIQGFMTMFIESDIAPSYAGWGMSMTYSEVRHSDTVFTIVFDEYLYTGGAHGIPITVNFTFDTDTETQLTLDDVFTNVDEGLATVVPLAVAQITETLGEFADADWIAGGTDPEVEENYATWALSDDGIIFYFGAYQVAPYAAGTQIVTIPFADLADVLEPAFVPSV